MSENAYFVPHSSKWPFLASVSAFILFFGLATAIHDVTMAGVYIGLLLVLAVMYLWFRDVIHEDRQRVYGVREDKSFRWGMMWFIVSEVFFFGAFFGALFYARVLSVPWLGGAGHGELTHFYLWPDFISDWPLLIYPALETATGAFTFSTPEHLLHAWGIPALNTLILLTSGVTITWAHHGLRANRRQQLTIGLALTVALGALFLSLQIYEYAVALDAGLTLQSGIYGSVFYMLTGFHGLHVLVGTTMLSVMLYRSIKGDFSPQQHFAFEATAWYWHFVDIVWLILFVFVYWL